MVRVRFLPFKCFEFGNGADAEGWEVSEFSSEREAWGWAAGNVGFVEDAYFIKSGAYLLRDGRLCPDE